MTHHPRHRHLLAAATLAAIAAAPAVAGDGAWTGDYLEAVALIEQGNLEEAAPLLDRIIAAHPLPALDVAGPGEVAIDYLPYLHRARLELRRGDVLAALRSLDVSLAFGGTRADAALERWVATLRRQARSALHQKGVRATRAALLHGDVPES